MYYYRIKETREKRNVTQKEIANILEIKQQQYSLYEKGTREIPTKHLKKLAIYLNISTDYLLEISDNPKIKKE